MSKLYYTEAGNVVRTLCEELTNYRRARKALRLPGTRTPATLYLLARAYPDHNVPLRLAVNGVELSSIAPTAPDLYFWYDVSIPPSLLVPGANMFELWTEAPAMNAWSLALEGGHREPDSFVTSDGGRTWRNERMGYLNVLRGEYIVRVRLAEGSDPAPPAMVWEDPDASRLRRLREMVPRGALEPGPTLDRVRALTTWVCTGWEYRRPGDSAQFPPWDAETILAWGRAARGHGGCSPVLMCVHYGVTLATCCLAVGIPARCAAYTGSIDGYNGHFTAEVWFDELDKWVLVDPTLDAIFLREGVPLSVPEIQQAGGKLMHLVQWGPGYEFQRRNPVLVPWIRENFAKGICFRHRSVWPRMDFLTHPELAPSGHGSTSYCETGFVWETRDLQEGFGMFPYFGDDDYFEAPPCAFVQTPNAPAT